MNSPAITRSTVSGEALFILKNLKENSRLSRSNKLADVKSSLEPSVSLDFDSYFFFLRKFHYIAMDREAQLKVTDQGERVVEGEYLEKFSSEVGEFFSEQLSPEEDESTEGGPEGEAADSMPDPFADPPSLLDNLIPEDEQGLIAQDDESLAPQEESLLSEENLISEQESLVQEDSEPLEMAPPPPPPPPPARSRKSSLLIDEPVAAPSSRRPAPVAEEPLAPPPPPRRSAISLEEPPPAPRRSAISLEEPPPAPRRPAISLEEPPPAPRRSAISLEEPPALSLGRRSASPSEEPLVPQITQSLGRSELTEPRRDSPFAPPAPPPTATSSSNPAVGSPTKGTDIDLRYVKFDPLGSGPLGTVFKGRHNALGLDICVKELKDIFGYFSFLQRGEVIKRLKRELCAQAQVRHPGIVAVLDQNTDVARPYFVMELLHGSLREKLDQSGGKGLPIALAMRYFLQLSYALRAAHAQGLTHHNLKPENVLFDIYGNVKLGDFGLARVIEVDQSKGMPQVFVGTGGMGYMSPELISRSKDTSASADVYGLGIMLYEMTTGQIPGRRSPLPSEVNSEVPSKLDPIFDRMTQDRKDSRYPDCDAMLEDFYGAFSDGEFLTRGDLLLWSDPQP